MLLFRSYNSEECWLIASIACCFNAATPPSAIFGNDIALLMFVVRLHQGSGLNERSCDWLKCSLLCGRSYGASHTPAQCSWGNIYGKKDCLTSPKTLKKPCVTTLITTEKLGISCRTLTSVKWTGRLIPSMSDKANVEMEQ